MTYKRALQVSCRRRARGAAEGARRRRRRQMRNSPLLRLAGCRMEELLASAAASRNGEIGRPCDSSTAPAPPTRGGDRCERPTP